MNPIAAAPSCNEMALLTQRRPVVTKKPAPLKPLRVRLRLSKLPKRGQLGQ